VIEQGKPARCLVAVWSPAASGVGVDSDGVSGAASAGGARFAAVPKSESSL